MEKKKLGIIMGGMSTENEISLKSANSILCNLDREKYEIYPIYIDRKGNWWNFKFKNENDILEEMLKTKNIIKNQIEYLNNLDVVFPILHGKYGEDGTIQGLLELLKIPYVGCNVLASSVGMDKIYTKIIFNQAGLKQAKYEYIKKNKDKYIYIDKNFSETELELKEIVNKICKNITFPMFVKPSNSGSSIGINRAIDIKELEKAIIYASQFDNKIIIEQGIEAKEVECAVLGNDKILVSCVGEVKSAEEFYSYNAKYDNKESVTEIPANISNDIAEKIRKQAKQAFKAIDGKGLSRVDFFVEKHTGEIYINEINTMPGFTNISMYPKLFEKNGVKYKDLLDRLIDLAFEKL